MSNFFLVFSLSNLFFLFFKTSRNYFVGIDQKNLTCSFDCNCPQGRFEPICGTNGITYLSPCLAGCSSIHINNTEVTIFDF